MEGLLKDLPQYLPYFLLMYNKRDDEYFCYNYMRNDESVLYLCPFFICIISLFTSNPPHSFTDERWLKRLKKMLYKEQAFVPFKPPQDIPNFEVDMDNVVEFMNDNFPEHNWIFVYDDCKEKFHVCGSDPQEDECPLICFLRVFLSQVTKGSPFFDLPYFMFDIQKELEFNPSVKDMKIAIHAWLTNRTSTLELVVGANYREEEMRNLNDKGKEDL
jgi:hypothetical protein